MRHKIVQNVTILLLFSTTVPMRAQVGEVAGAAAGGIAAYVTGRKLIEQARSAASQAIGEGLNGADALRIKFGNELNIASDTAIRTMGADLDKKIDRLSEQNRLLLANIDALTRQVGRLSWDAYRVEDAMVLDLRAVLANYPFGEKFYVQRIGGALQLYKDQDRPYRVSIAGVGLGIPSQNRRATVTFLLDKKPVKNLTVKAPSANSAELEIPNPELSRLFDQEKMKAVNATFEIDYEVRSGVLSKTWKKAHYSVPIQLALMPRLAGKITLETRAPKFDWVRIKDSRDVRQTGNHHCESHCQGEPTRTGYTASVEVSGGASESPKVGDRKLANPRLSCISGSCAFSGVERVYLTNQDSRAIANFSVWSRPTTWELVAETWEYQELPFEDVKTSEYRLEFGRNIEMVVPKAMTVGHLTGRTVVRQPIDVIVGSPDPLGLLQLLKDTKGEPGQRRLVYFVKPPVEEAGVSL